MKTYYIYNLENDDFLGTVKATSIASAETKAIKELEYSGIPSEYIVAFSERI